MQALEYEASFATARYLSPLVKTFNDFSKICVSVSRAALAEMDRPGEK